MDRKRQKLTPGKNDVEKECQDEKITALERKLEHMENKLKLVIAELEQVKEERACDKINFEKEKCELESKIDKYKEQCTELQSENGKLQNENGKLQSENGKLQNENGKLQNANEKLQGENKRLQNYLQDLESANINVEEKSQIYNTDLNSQITKVNESNDDALDINSLPNEIIVNIFGYLEQNQLGQIARVCRRWNVLIRSPVLWEKVNVEFSPSHECQTTVAESFINGLPSCTTSIELNFTESGDWIEKLHFAELCVKLQGKCPHLEEFILTDTELSHSLPSVIDLCTHFLQDVKNLVFIECIFTDYSARGEYFGISKIEILELLSCNLNCVSKPPFSKMPHLKQLHLYGTEVKDSWFEDETSFLNQLHVFNVGGAGITPWTFQAIQNHGHNLKELYVCDCYLVDHEIALNNSIFPHLKTICLNRSGLPCEYIVSLIQSCPSLENVYVDEDVAESFAAHPYVAARICKSGIVKAISYDHIHNNYCMIN